MLAVDLPPTVRQAINEDLTELNANAETQLELAENDEIQSYEKLVQPKVVIDHSIDLVALFEARRAAQTMTASNLIYDTKPERPAKEKQLRIPNYAAIPKHGPRRAEPQLNSSVPDLFHKIADARKLLEALPTLMEKQI